MVKAAVEALVIVGASALVSVNVCVAAGLVALAAVMVIG